MSNVVAVSLEVLELKKLFKIQELNICSQNNDIHDDIKLT